MYRFVVPTAAPLAKNVRFVLSKVSAAAVIEDAGADIAVRTPAGALLSGVSTLISALQRLPADQVSDASWIGATTAQRAQISQWVALAASPRAESWVEVETLVPSTGYLAGGSKPTAADVFLLGSASAFLASADAAKCPKLSAWLARARKDLPEVAPELPAGAAAAHVDPAVGGAKGPAASAFPKPTAEEIAARRAEKEKAKAEKAKEEGAAPKPAPKAAAAAAAAAPQASDLDIRVGLIKSVSRHPTADRLFVESIDLGEAAPRTIVSGLVEHYAAEALNGQQVFVVCNMKPKALQGVESNGMVLCVGGTEGRPLKLLQPAGTCAPGTRAAFGGSAAPTGPLPAIPSGSKMGDLLGGLKTDGAGAATWNGQPMFAGGNAVTSAIVDAPIK